MRKIVMAFFIFRNFYQLIAITKPLTSVARVRRGWQPFCQDSLLLVPRLCFVRNSDNICEHLLLFQSVLAFKQYLVRQLS